MIATSATAAAASAAQDLAKAAHDAAEQGWRVFPLHSIRGRAEDDGRLVCTCGNAECDAPGKHGALRGKRIQDHASSDLPTVRRWWKDLSSPRNIAAATGRASGILVVDIDAGGAQVLAALELRYAPLPATLEARTGTGGRHLYFRHPATGSYPSTTGRLGERINTVGEDGYVVLPPSLHRSGTPYAWVDASAQLADLPAWVIGLWAPAATVEIGTVPTADEDPREHVPGLDPWAVCRGSVTGEDVRPSLSALAGALAQAEVDPDSLRQRVREINKRRCSPPLPTDDVDGICFAAIAEDQSRRTDERSSLSKLPKVVADGRSAADQRVLAAIRDRERRSQARDPARSALRAWVDTYWAVLDFDEPRGELRLVWLETGEVVEIPIAGSQADVEGRIAYFVGGTPGFWAARAHEKCTSKLLVGILKSLLGRATKRKREDVDGAAVQLVQTLLAAEVWPETTGPDGNPRRWKRSLATVWGFFPDDGIGKIHSRGQALLVVHVTKLANGGLRSHPEFRGLSAKRLLALLRAAPGALPKPVRPAEARQHCDTDYWAVDLNAFHAVVGRNSEAADVIEIDQEISPNPLQPRDSPRNAGGFAGGNHFPASSHLPPNDDDDGRTSDPPGETGKNGGTSGGTMDDIFYPRNALKTTSGERGDGPI